MIGNYLASPRHNRNIWQSLSERLANAGWTVITTSDKENQLLRLLDMLCTVIKGRKKYALAQIDVFSGLAFTYAEFCVSLLRLLKKPIILTLHGGRLPEFAQKFPRRVNHLLKSVEVVVTPSPFLQQSLQIFCASICFIPNPVDLSSSIYRQRSKPIPNLIWVRAFHEIYNPSLAIQVINELKDEFPEIRLTMVGPIKSKSSKNQMMELSVDLMVNDRLVVIPGVANSEIPYLLDQSDIFINTSNYDTAPRSLIEAMANGLCIVTTNVGGIPWLVEDQEEALLVPPNDPKAMAAAVKRILTEPGLAAKLSVNARSRAEKLDWSGILPQWETLFIEVIEQHNVPSGKSL